MANIVINLFSSMLAFCLYGALSLNPDFPLALYCGRTTHRVMSPLELLQRLATLVPRPRLNPIRYHGVLAPNAKWRSQVVPAQTASQTVSADAGPAESEALECQQEKKRGGRYLSWASLLRRVFDLNMETCPNCGEPVKIIAAIEDPSAIKKILTHLGLSPHPPPRAPARYDAYDEADIYATY